MRRFINGVMLLAAVVAVDSARPLFAQNRVQAWEVVPYLGWVSFGDPAVIDGLPLPGDQATVKNDDDLNFGFRFGYHITKKQMVEFTFNSLATDSSVTLFLASTMTTKFTDMQTDVVTGDINYTYNFFVHHRDKVVLYLTGGLGLINTSTFGTSPDPDLQRLLDDLVGDEVDIAYNYGGGIRLFGSPKIGVRFDLRQYRYDVEPQGDLDFLEFSVGLTMILGGP